jgi:predicted anti-sigma-YlaC factor YlaD
VNEQRPFDPREDAALLSAYVDGELAAQDLARVEAYLAENAAARREVEKIRQLKTMTGSLRLKDPPPEEWEIFWRGVYNRLERSVGWLLLLAGLVICGGWAMWQLAVALYLSENLPMIVKLAVGLGASGLLVLLVSVIRERIYKRQRTRYRHVIR